MQRIAITTRYGGEGSVDIKQKQKKTENQSVVHANTLIPMYPVLETESFEYGIVVGGIERRGTSYGSG